MTVAVIAFIVFNILDMNLQSNLNPGLAHLDGHRPSFLLTLALYTEITVLCCVNSW